MKRFVGASFVLAGLVSCGPSAPEPAVIRLVDIFSEATVEGGSATPEIPRTQWRFQEGSALGWKAGVGVSNLRVVDGGLAGRAETDFPIVHVERTSGLDDPDVLHAVEVRARFSSPGDLELLVLGDEDLDFRAIRGRRESAFAWPFRTPVVPGDEFQTYTMTDADPIAVSLSASDTRHVLLRPPGGAGGEFVIESVRLVFRKEHLASIPSGVSWQGFGNVFRETLVTRAPETAHFDTTLPSRPFLDLAVGTVESGPVTFRVAIDGRDGSTVVLEKTVTTAHRWDAVLLDLEEYAGERVTLSLSLESERDGALGFWGSPALRNRGAAPSTRGEAGVKTPPPRGVILFVADTLRRDHLELYGHSRETAPHLTRLASEGAYFVDTQAQGTWTKVSVPSIHTSLYPTSHGISQLTDRLPASATTLAEVYREAGYATISFSSVAFSGKGSNLHQGFEELHERDSLELPEGVARSKTARAYLDRLLPWLEAHRDVPFFVFFHVMDAHSPFRPYHPYDELWASPGAGEEHRQRTDRVLPFIEDGFMKQQELPSREELEKAGIDAESFVAHERDWYDGSIRALDVELARLVEALEQLDLEGDTLLAFISDHGEEFLEHGRHWHGTTVYGDMTNVPLVLWAPGRIPAGTVVTELVQSIDLMPTLLELSHLSVPEAAQGQSLVPLLQGERGRFRSRPAFSERFRQRASFDTSNFQSVLTDGWKLVHNLDASEGKTDRPEFELYDHEKDPLNLVDVAEKHPDVVAKLSALLADWRKFVEAGKLPSDDEITDGMNAEELERLRSLGYVQ